MKKLLIIVGIISAINVTAQTSSPQTASGVLEKEIVSMLQSDGILLKQSEIDCKGDCSNIGLWKNNSKRDKWLKNDNDLKKRFVNKFKAPSFCENRMVITQLIFKNKSVGLLGSYIVRNNDLSILNSSSTPKLPILENGTQISIFSPRSDGSNYLLNYTSNKLFEGSLESGVSSEFKDFYTAKILFNGSISNENRSQISIGAGVFENKLAKIYGNIEQISSNEFEPVFLLWNEYRKGNIQANDQIIKSFEGLCYFSMQGIDKKETEEFSGEVGSSGKYPFLNYNLNVKTKWTNNNSLTTQRNIYNVYMFSQPDLLPIPTKEKIIACWNNLKPSDYVIKSTTATTDNNIPANSPLILRVKFGPIPNNEVLTIIKLDEEYSISKLPSELKKTIKSIRLVTDDLARITSENGYYYFDVEVTRDEPFLAQTFNSINPKISLELNLRIYYNNPIGSDTLSVEYKPITISTELHPTPSSEYEITSSKLGQTYKYSIPIKFNISNLPLTIVSTPKPPKIIDVYGLPTSIHQNLKKQLTDASFILKGTNEYTGNFSIPINNNYFDINQRSHEIVVLLEFYANNGTTYKRKLPLKLIAPNEMLEASTATNIILNGNQELLTALKSDAIIKGNLTVSEFIAKYTSNGQTDILKFVDGLKELNVINQIPNGNYVVPVKLVDIEKIKK
jgi:hypothetical protein